MTKKFASVFRKKSDFAVAIVKKNHCKTSKKKVKKKHKQKKNHYFLKILIDFFFSIK